MRAQVVGVPRWMRDRWIGVSACVGMGESEGRTEDGRWVIERCGLRGCVGGSASFDCAGGADCEAAGDGSFGGSSAVGTGAFAEASSMFGSVSGGGGPSNIRSQSHAHPMPTSPFLPSPRSTASHDTRLLFGLLSQAFFFFSLSMISHCHPALDPG